MAVKLVHMSVVISRHLYVLITSGPASWCYQMHVCKIGLNVAWIGRKPALQILFCLYYQFMGIFALTSCYCHKYLMYAGVIELSLVLHICILTILMPALVVPSAILNGKVSKTILDIVCTQTYMILTGLKLLMITICWMNCNVFVCTRSKIWCIIRLYNICLVWSYENIDL